MSEYKQVYKVGDEVVIKPDALCNNPDLSYLGPLAGTDRVMELIRHDGSDGDTCFRATIKRADYAYCLITTDILGHHFSYGEEIEVSDDGERWYKELFIAYCPGVQRQVRSLVTMATGVTTRWKFARKIKEPVIKVTVEVNGELKDPSFLSEETWLKLRG